MWINVRATRESGLTYKGPTDIKGVEVVKGLEPYAPSIIVSFKGHRAPTSHAVPTKYDGQLDFTLGEVAQLFRAAVENSTKSDDFKRLVAAMLVEL